MLHRLKTTPQAFERMADGSKTFEVRRNDRYYQPSDVLELFPYVPGMHECDDPSCTSRWDATGKPSLLFTVGFVLAGKVPGLGLDLGEFVVMSLLPPPLFEAQRRRQEAENRAAGLNMDDARTAHPGAR